MRVTMLVVMVLAMGCAEKGERGPSGEPGARGADGAPGAKGDPGERGAAGARGADGTAIAGARIVLWVDATGAVIGPEPVFIDDAGVQWPLNLESGTVAPLALYEGVYFASNDCTGQALRPGYAPRMASSLPLADGGTQLVVRDDSTQAVTITYGLSTGSVRLLDGNCSFGNSFNQRLTVVPVEAFRELRAPTASFVPPLRKEWR